MVEATKVTIEVEVPTLVDAVIEKLSEDGTLVEVVRCGECKYFDLDSWANIGGVPLIVAHEICKRWGDGCKTSKDGFCFIGERKETDDG